MNGVIEGLLATVGAFLSLAIGLELWAAMAVAAGYLLHLGWSW